jgi:hypothetical protein
MLRKILVSAAALSLAGPAMAASFVIGFGPFAPVTIPADGGGTTGNQFSTNLNALGLNAYVSKGSTLGVSAAVGEVWTITFRLHGYENGYKDAFTATGDGVTTFGSATTGTYTGLTGWTVSPAGFGTISGVGSVASLAGILNYTSSGGAASTVGDANEGFGIFIDAGSRSQNTGTIYFGYDDVPGGDDNHDDGVISATIRAVPEPSTWAMMVLGFGVVGRAMRSRRRNAIASFA